MSFYFREKPRFGDDKNREKTDDELFEDLKQRFDNNKTFFDRSKKLRDPFDRHTSGFSRVSTYNFYIYFFTQQNIES